VTASSTVPTIGTVFTNVPLTLNPHSGIFTYFVFNVTASGPVTFQLTCNPLGGGWLYLGITRPSSTLSFNSVATSTTSGDQVITVTSIQPYSQGINGVYYVGVSAAQSGVITC
jgi:hypothetical protein